MTQIGSCLVAIVSILVALEIHAGEVKPIPDSLFGVKLGGVHALPMSNDHSAVGTLPVKEVKGVEQFLGTGLHYYFKPLKEYQTFRYVELRKKPDDKHFATSFRLYLLPVFPKDAARKMTIDPAALKWEIALIEWTDDPPHKRDAYLWARDLCKNIEADLGKKPDTTDYPEQDWYSCSFRERDRELTVETLLGKKIMLRYPEAVFKRKDDAADAMRRKLQMNYLRPY